MKNTTITNGGSWKILTIRLLCFIWPRILKFYVYCALCAWISFSEKIDIGFLYHIRMSESIRGKSLNLIQKYTCTFNEKFKFKKLNCKVKLRFRFSFKKDFHCKKRLYWVFKIKKYWNRIIVWKVILDQKCSSNFANILDKIHPKSIVKYVFLSHFWRAIWIWK